jgi:hypothetical protein
VSLPKRSITLVTVVSSMIEEKMCDFPSMLEEKMSDLFPTVSRKSRKMFVITKRL